MKLNIKIIVPISFIISLSGCAFGPLYSHDTAQTVGSNRFEMVGGYGNAGMAAKATFGLMDNLDIGIHWESLSIGLKLKYAFINNHDSGLSVAGTAGIGDSFGGVYYTAAGSISYLTNEFEPYFMLRGVYVNYNSSNSSNSSVSVNGSSLNLPEYTYSYSYLEPVLGSRLWLTPGHFFLSAEVGGIVIGSGAFAIASGALGYRF
jgi:hypothetical protein